MTSMDTPATQPPPGARVSEFDAALIRQLEQHLEDESTILAEYRDLADSSDEVVRYLAQLIIEDEQRHHRVLTEILNRFRTSAWFIEQKPHVPWFTRSSDPDELKQCVRRLQAYERHDLRKLKKLKRRLGVLRRDSINGTLVRALIMDTRKHLLYLKTLDRAARKK
jgi:hypothetical protein